MQFGGGGSQLPAEIEALLEPSVDRKATVPMWKAFRKVYGSDAAAIAAAEKNVIPILSFINTEENIRENWQVCMLQETLRPEREPKPKPEPEPTAGRLAVASMRRLGRHRRQVDPRPAPRARGPAGPGELGAPRHVEGAG